MYIQVFVLCFVYPFLKQGPPVQLPALPAIKDWFQQVNDRKQQSPHCLMHAHMAE